MPPLVMGPHEIKQLIFVMPVWLAWAFEETLTVTVKTKEWGTASDTIEVKMLTFY